MNINDEVLREFYASERKITMDHNYNYIAFNILDDSFGVIEVSFKGTKIGELVLCKDCSKQEVVLHVPNIVNKIYISRYGNKLEISKDISESITLEFKPELIKIMTPVNIYDEASVDREKYCIDRIEIVGFKATDGDMIEISPNSSNRIMNLEKGWETIYSGSIVSDDIYSNDINFSIYAKKDRSGKLSITVSNNIYCVYVRVYKFRREKEMVEEVRDYIPERKDISISSSELARFFRGEVPIEIKNAVLTHIDIPENTYGLIYIINKDQDIPYVYVNINKGETLLHRRTIIKLYEKDIEVDIIVSEDLRSVNITKHETNCLTTKVLPGLFTNDVTLDEIKHERTSLMLKFIPNKTRENTDDLKNDMMCEDEAEICENLEMLDMPRKGFHLHIYGKIYYVNGYIYDAGSKDEGRDVSYIGIYKHSLGWFTKWRRDINGFSKRYMVEVIPPDLDGDREVFSMERYMKISIFSAIYILIVSLIEKLFFNGEINKTLRKPVENKRRVARIYKGRKKHITDISITMNNRDEYIETPGTESFKTINHSKISFVKLIKIWSFRYYIERYIEGWGE